MVAKIDQNLIPQTIRDSVDPEILNRAQSIEWSIDRDTGENEHGFLDGSPEDFLSGQNLLAKSLGPVHTGHAMSRKMVEFSSDSLARGAGRDSGFEATPVSPALDLSPLDGLPNELTMGANGSQRLGRMKSHPRAQSGPYPMYKVNQQQLSGDVFFEVAPQSKPGERTVHYEKSSRVLNEEELNAMGLDPNTFGPNSRTTMDEQEEETVETEVLDGRSRELEAIYAAMRQGAAGDYFDRQRARSLSPSGGRAPLVDGQSSEQRRTVVFGSMGEIDKCAQEYYPYRDAHQGKVRGFIFILAFSTIYLASIKLIFFSLS